MILVSGIVEVEAANHAAAAALMRTLAEETAKEEGSVTYAFYADLAQPGTFRVFEEWKSEDAISSHFGEPHMAAFMEGLGALGVKGTNVMKYTVSDSSKIM